MKLAVSSCAARRAHSAVCTVTSTCRAAKQDRPDASRSARKPCIARVPQPLDVSLQANGKGSRRCGEIGGAE
eukprot:scaffold25495_cov30-Tisochrysis_lutea.AAC.13